MSFRAVKLVAEESTAKGSEKLILMLIAMHQHPETGACFPSIPTLARMSGLARSRVATIITSLETAGELSHENRINPKGGVGSNAYTIHLPAGGGTSSGQDGDHPAGSIPPIQRAGWGTSCGQDAKGNLKENFKDNHNHNGAPRPAPAARRGGGGEGGKFSGNEIPDAQASENGTASSSPEKRAQCAPPPVPPPPSPSNDEETHFLRAFRSMRQWHTGSKAFFNEKMVLRLFHSARDSGIPTRTLLRLLLLAWEQWVESKDVEGFNEHFAAKFAWPPQMAERHLSALRDWADNHGFDDDEAKRLLGVADAAWKGESLPKRDDEVLCETAYDDEPEIGALKRVYHPVSRWHNYWSIFTGWRLGLAKTKASESWVILTDVDPKITDEALIRASWEEREYERATKGVFPENGAGGD
jgi:helix-turn-helix protein